MFHHDARPPRRRPDRAPARTVVLPVPAEHAWAMLLDVRRHARWVPMTRIEVDGPLPLVTGSVFTAVSGPGARSGRRGLIDTMRVDVATAPDSASGRRGHARFTKLGPVLTGWAELDVLPQGPDRTEVTWTERIGVRGLPRWLTDVLGALPTLAMLHHVLRRVADDAQPR
jgi:carbon monoxide dehydrogenase subunit G